MSPNKVFYVFSARYSEFSVGADAIYNTLVLKYNLVMYTLSGSSFKGSLIERFNRSLKSRIARFMTEHGTTRWVDGLPGLTAAYNMSYHRSIRMSPNEASLPQVCISLVNSLYNYNLE